MRTTQLGPLERDRARGGLDGQRLVTVAVARPGRRRAGVAGALVAVSAEELGDLGLQRGLEHEPDAGLGHVLEDLTEGLVGGEQVVDLGADALDGR
jgi:hypothetical protein